MEVSMMRCDGRYTFVRLGLRTIPSLVVFCAAVLAAGCDKKSDPGKDGVSGKVTLDGKGVSGTVVFVAADKKEYPALLSGDGKYTVADLPAGDYKVAVRSMTGGAGPAPKGGGSMPDAGGGGAGSGPPAKYASADTSGLTFKRTSGKQEYDIPLTP